MQPWNPVPLPPDGIDINRIYPLATKAHRELGTYDGELRIIINPLILLSPLMTQEAVMSSRIEGTIANLDDVLGDDAGIALEGKKADDAVEIRNYRKAMLDACSFLGTKGEVPLNLWLVRSLHDTLMNSTRGADKSPGQLRMTQNRIGGVTAETARFMPPDPIRVPALMDEWMAYITSEQPDEIVQAAIIHAQFEIIHPFDDGNGRLGRMFITLFLFHKKMISAPTFYLSSYFDKHRDEYLDRLQAVTKEGDWTGWVEFFLRAVAEQAKLNGRVLSDINTLYRDMQLILEKELKTRSHASALNALFKNPKFSASEFGRDLGIDARAARRILKPLRDQEFISVAQESSGSRPGIYQFDRLLDIVRAAL